MPERKIREKPTSLEGRVTAQNACSGTVFFNRMSNSSLFTPGDGDRFSYASDFQDHDSLASDIYLKLAVCDDEAQESCKGPVSDPIPDKESTGNDDSRHIRKEEKEKDSNELQNLNSTLSLTHYSRQLEGVKKDDANLEDDNRSLDSARSSVSVAIKESLDWSDRSEVRLRKPEGRSRSSLHLNNVVVSSPRSVVMKKNVVSSRWYDPLPDTGAPNSWITNVKVQKGWSSERVASASRRSVTSASLAFNNGKTLPSKWEDAERWIFSPASRDDVIGTSLPPPQRRAKSKSGPLGGPGESFNSLHSPAILMFEGENAGNFIVDSPLSAGVMSTDGLTFSSRNHGNGRTEPCMSRSVSLHACSQTRSTFACLQGNLDVSKGAISRRDIATQITAEDNSSSTTESTPSTSTSTSIPSTLELKNMRSSKVEVRDVQVDKQVTMKRGCEKEKIRLARKGKADGWLSKDKDLDSQPWNVSDTAKSILKLTREEAKITAWENLQKAKAEASIRKLEHWVSRKQKHKISILIKKTFQMKLEKRRSSSMDKIMKKLRSSQRRAQEMRSSILVNKAHKVARTSHKALSIRRADQKSSLSGCFTCYAI